MFFEDASPDASCQHCFYLICGAAFLSCLPLAHSSIVWRRHIDTAPGYKNEPHVGRAIQRCKKVQRKDVWITTKIQNSDQALLEHADGDKNFLPSYQPRARMHTCVRHLIAKSWTDNDAIIGYVHAISVLYAGIFYFAGKARVLAAVQRSLDNLQTDYVDMLLVHSPMARTCVPGPRNRQNCLHCSSRLVCCGPDGLPPSSLGLAQPGNSVATIQFQTASGN